MLQRGGISMWQHMAATEFARPTPITSNHAEAQTIFLSFLILVGSAWNFEWCRFTEFWSGGGPVPQLQSHPPRHNLLQPEKA